MGGVLQVETLTLLKQNKAHAPLCAREQKSPFGQHSARDAWDTDLTYQPVLELGGTRSERFARYSRMEEILSQLPGLDCGSCGALPARRWPKTWCAGRPV